MSGILPCIHFKTGTFRHDDLLRDIFLHGFLRSPAQVFQSDVPGIVGGKDMKGVLRQAGADAGAQIFGVFGPGGFLGQCQGQVFKIDITDVAGLVSIDQYPVLAGAVYIFKGNVSDTAKLGGLLSPHGGYGYGLGLSPPVYG